jgi:hypothetical protein
MSYLDYAETSGTSYGITQGRIPEKWVSQETSHPNGNQKKQSKKQQQIWKNDVTGNYDEREKQGLKQARKLNFICRVICAEA